MGSTLFIFTHDFKFYKIDGKRVWLRKKNRLLLQKLSSEQLPFPNDMFLYSVIYRTLISMKDKASHVILRE